MDLLPKDKVIFNAGTGNDPIYLLGTIKDIRFKNEGDTYNIIPCDQPEKLYTVRLNKIVGRSIKDFQVGQIPIEEVHTFLPRVTKPITSDKDPIFKEGFNAAVIKMDVLLIQLTVKAEFILDVCSSSSNIIDACRVPFLRQRIQDLTTLKTQLPKLKI